MGSSRSNRRPRSAQVVCAFDKFRDTATARELCEAAAAAARSAGYSTVALPLGDGGEGSLDALGGANKVTTVTGPLGEPVEAAWRLSGHDAYIEMAAASGLALVGGADHNDPIGADTFGTGELIAAAVELGARRVVVLLGGSATTDGGFGALRAMPPAPRFKGIELIAACDVTTRFIDAARVFGPQKGASAAQVELLTRRLRRLEQVYVETYGVDVSAIDGAGAAGGLAGGLMAVGGRIESGFDVIAESVGLDEALVGAEVVVTGEGFLDAESFNGKVVGGVASWAAHDGVDVLVVVGDRLETVDVALPMTVVSLTERYGYEAAVADPVTLTREVVEQFLRDR